MSFEVQAENKGVPQLHTNTSISAFYAIGHNTNSIQEVQEALQAGANALEPDINIYTQDPGELCISHFEGDAGAPSLVQFLTALHEIAAKDNRLSLVLFDCKKSVASAEHGLTILTAIRKYLTSDTDLNIIISVSDLTQVAIFDQIKGLLGPREGLMIDETNDPELIVNYFKDNGIENSCYGNGTSVPLMPVTGPHVRPSIERACALRAATGMPKFIGVWTVNEERLKEQFIHIGVDAIITDDLKELTNCIKDPRFHSTIRMANRLDNPFRTLNNAYSLTVYTGDRHMAGSDSNICFTLTGTEGSAQITVDASLRRRMERNNINYITLRSADLGVLSSITVQRDEQGAGPDWWLEKIIVERSGFMTAKVALFNRDINSTHPFTAALT